MTPEEMLEQFCGDIPTLGLLGSPHKILNEIPFLIDEEVQLVCKYLKAHKEKRIDRLYKVGMLIKLIIIKFNCKSAIRQVLVLINALLGIVYNTQ